METSSWCRHLLGSPFGKFPCAPFLQTDLFVVGSSGRGALGQRDMSGSAESIDGGRHDDRALATRRPLLATALLAVAVLASGRDGLPLFWVSQERGWEPWRDLAIARAMQPLHPAQRDYVGAGYPRDRDYAPFLWKLQPQLSEASRVFLHVSGEQDWYRYRAAYRLAPVPVELFDAERQHAAGDVLMSWRVPTPAGWTVFFTWGDGTLAHRDQAP